jgi:hypothetical protein
MKKPRRRQPSGVSLLIGNRKRAAETARQERIGEYLIVCVDPEKAAIGWGNKWQCPELCIPCLMTAQDTQATFPTASVSPYAGAVLLGNPRTVLVRRVLAVRRTLFAATGLWHPICFMARILFDYAVAEQIVFLPVESCLAYRFCIFGDGCALGYFPCTLA